MPRLLQERVQFLGRGFVAQEHDGPDNAVAYHYLMYPDLVYRGGDDGIRTHDPHVANVMLSQLSYIPT